MFILFFLPLYIMRSFKKIIATISLVTMLIASTIVNAAPLDSATASITLNGSGNTETLTVLWAQVDENGWDKDFTDNIDSVKIKNNDDVLVYENVNGDGITNNADGSFTIDAIDFETVAGDVIVALITGTRYTISFTTDSWDFWSAVLVINEDNRLTVSATVQPVLKFAIEWNTADFGVLTSDIKSISKWIEVWTNAINWVTVTAQTLNGWLKSVSASDHTIWLSADPLYSSEEYKFTSTLGTPDSASSATIDGMALSDVTSVGQVFPVYSTNKPQNFETAIGGYDTSFIISTKISDSTPSASDYKDIIIFTATANF